jgi:hypothetical protein
VDVNDETAEAEFDGETGDDADSLLVGSADAVDACDAFDDALACNALGEAAPVLIIDDDTMPLRVASPEDTAEPLASGVIEATSVGEAVRESRADFVTFALSETHDDCEACSDIDGSFVASDEDDVDASCEIVDVWLSVSVTVGTPLASADAVAMDSVGAVERVANALKEAHADELCESDPQLDGDAAFEEDTTDDGETGLVGTTDGLA